MKRGKVYGGSTIKEIDSRLQEMFWIFLMSTIREEAKDRADINIKEHVSNYHPFRSSFDLPFRMSYYVATRHFTKATPGDSVFMRWLCEKDEGLYDLVQEAKSDGYEFTIKL